MQQEKIGKFNPRLLCMATTVFIFVLMIPVLLHAQNSQASAGTDNVLLANVLDVDLANGLSPAAAKPKCDTLTNPQCCGSATNICSTNGMATVTCAAGVCNGTCAALHGDCNGNKLTDGCETVLNTPNNCGQCLNICPGFGRTNVNVTCNISAQCAFSCQGENYDVNNNPNDGCEQADANPPGHNQSTATSIGSKDNNDTNATFSHVISSDARVHENPAVAGFDSSTGAAQHWWSVNATGGIFGIDDLAVTFTVSGSTNPSCYRITVITNKNTQTCATSSSGSCTLNSGSGSYTDGSAVFFEVQKTCNSTTREAVNYTVQYHL